MRAEPTQINVKLERSLTPMGVILEFRGISLVRDPDQSNRVAITGERLCLRTGVGKYAPGQMSRR